MKNKVFAGIMLAGLLTATACSAQGVMELKGDNELAQSKEVKTIFSFKKEIGLTDEQENKMKSVLYDDQMRLTTQKGTLNTLLSELSQMINTKADMKIIRAKLEEISKVQVDMSCRDIETARKIDAILSPAQIEKWKTIKKNAVSELKK